MGGAEGNATATCLPPPKEHIEEPILYFILAILVGVIVLYFLNVKLLKKVKVFLPYTVLCFLGSFALGLGVQFTEDMHVRWRFRAMLEHSVNQWESAPPHLIVFVFLPPLLFNDAMSLDIHLWSKKLLQCVVLAVPGVIMGTFLTAGSAFALTSDFRSVWSWEICLVLGAILSATDPVAVVSLLKSLGAPREITMIITGESLLNDGVAVVLFLLTFGMFEYNSIELGGLDHCYGEAYDAPKILTFFLRMAVAGPTIGIAFGALCVYVLNKTKHGEVEDHYTAQLMATLFTAYAAFYMAERVFKSSGVLSCVSAALFISWQGWPLFTDPATTKHVWHAFELVANTVIFSYAGLVSAEALSSDFRLSALWIGVALYAFVVLIRGIVIVLLYPLLWYLDRKDPIASLEAFLGFGDGIGDEKDAQSISAKHLYSKTKLLDLSFEAFYPAARTIGWRDLAMMSWGGLRGAVGLALALVVREELDHIVGEFKHEHPSVCDEGEDGFDAEDCEQLERLEDLGDQVLVVYVVVCLLTLVVNAPTSPAIMRYLDLKTRSTAIEELFIRSVVQQLHAESKAEYKKLAKHYILPPNWHGREMEAHEQEMRQQETRANRAGTPPEDSAPSAPGGPPGPRESELGDSNGHNGRDRPRVTRNRIQRFASLRVAGPPADPPAGDGTGGADGADGADAAAAGERAGTPLSALGSKKLSSLVKTLARPLSMNLGRHRRGESATSSGAACEAMYDMSLSYMVTELVERKRQSATLKRERSARRPRDALSDLRNEDIGAESVEDDDAADAAPAPVPGPGPEAPAAPAPARETLADLSAWRDSERSIDGARARRGADPPAAPAADPPTPLATPIIVDSRSLREVRAPPRRRSVPPRRTILTPTEGGAGGGAADGGFAPFSVQNVRSGESLDTGSEARTTPSGPASLAGRRSRSEMLPRSSDLERQWSVPKLHAVYKAFGWDDLRGASFEEGRGLESRSSVDLFARGRAMHEAAERSRIEESVQTIREELERCRNCEGTGAIDKFVRGVFLHVVRAEYWQFIRASVLPRGHLSSNVLLHSIEHALDFTTDGLYDFDYFKHKLQKKGWGEWLLTQLEAAFRFWNNLCSRRLREVNARIDAREAEREARVRDRDRRRADADGAAAKAARARKGRSGQHGKDGRGGQEPQQSGQEPQRNGQEPQRNGQNLQRNGQNLQRNGQNLQPNGQSGEDPHTAQSLRHGQGAAPGNGGAADAPGAAAPPDASRRGAHHRVHSDTDAKDLPSPGHGDADADADGESTGAGPRHRRRRSSASSSASRERESVLSAASAASGAVEDLRQLSDVMHSISTAWTKEEAACCDRRGRDAVEGLERILVDGDAAIKYPNLSASNWRVAQYALRQLRTLEASRQADRYFGINAFVRAHVRAQADVLKYFGQTRASEEYLRKTVIGDSEEAIHMAKAFLERSVDPQVILRERWIQLAEIAVGAKRRKLHDLTSQGIVSEAVFEDLDEDLQSKIEDLRKTRKEIDRIFALRATARESKLFRESHLEMLLQRRQRSQRSFSRLRPPNAQRHRAMALAANKRLADARRVPSPDVEVATVTRVGDAQV